ncbi:MAG: RNA-binding protein [Hyphomonadaceae bacterium]|jgi:hypothetical protein|nr:RNA-binding protein [Hyphomonadaceae bacterium]
MDRAERAEGRGRVRRCVATGESLPEDRLIRFVADPDGLLHPDVGARAPGRGVWVTASREAVQLAARKGGFARGLKQAVQAPADLADHTEAALERRLLELLGIARRAGQVIAGFDQVSAFLRARRPGWRVEALDGSADGRGKLDGLSRAWPGLPLCAQLSGAQLGMALGRDHVIHALLPEGALAQRWGAEAVRLAGFRPLVPDGWAI